MGAPGAHVVRATAVSARHRSRSEHLGARGTMRSVFFGGPPPRARTEPRGERGADVLENGRNGDVRAPRRQCSAQI